MKILFYTVGLLIVSQTVLSVCRRGSRNKFPEKFSFGVASSAHQIEGAWDEDGKGPNILDTFAHEYPGKIADRSNADQSGDSYHLYKVWDVPCIKSLGMDHYCFSISWSRILPDGILVNPKGIAFYSEFIDTLLENGIEPVATMFFLDLPQSIQNLGGFANEIVVDYFKVYADVLFANFGDRVKRWITIDSPSNLCTLIYGNGYLSPIVEPNPGITEYICGENVLKAHAAAYSLYHTRYARRFKGKVGITLYADYYYSESGNRYDVEKAMAFQLGWFAHPIFSGQGDYPAIMRQQVDSVSSREGYYSSRLPVLTDRWIRTINGSADFLGLNYYTSRIVKPIRGLNSATQCDYPFDTNLEYTVKPEWKKGKSSFLYSVPSGLGDMLRYIRDYYDDPEVLITRNGWSDDGEFIDLDRIDYLAAHMEEVLKAVNDGYNVVGYTVSDLYNSFEFREGYTTKFGLFDCDYSDPRLPLTPKASAEYMREVTSTHCIPDSVVLG